MATWIARDCGCKQEVYAGHKRRQLCEQHGNLFESQKVIEGRVDRARPAPLKRTNGFAASPAQRAKVKGEVCVGCGKEASDYLPIDPAHLIPRRIVSCDHADGVIPLCRECHRAYDEEHLDLLARLEERGYHREMGHFLTEHQINPLTLLRYVAGGEYAPAAKPSERTAA